MTNGLNTDPRLEDLKKSELFCRIDESSWQVICDVLETIVLETGDTLFQEGDLADAIYVLLEGELEISRSQADGSVDSCGIITPYRSIGDIQVLRGGRFTEQIYARTRCRLLRVPKTAVQNLSRHNPAEFQKLLEIVHQRIRKEQLRIILPRLFGKLDETAYAHIEKNIEWVHLKRGEILCRQGEPGDCIYIIISGRLRAVKDPGSPDERILNDVGRGEILGEMAFLTRGARSAMLYAIRDSELVKISQAFFETFAYEHPRTFLSIGQTLVSRLIKAETPHRQFNIQLNLAIVNICKDAPQTAFINRFIHLLASEVSLLHLNSAKLSSLLGVPEIAAIGSDDPLNVKLSSWFDEQESRHDIIIYETDSTPTNWTKRCLRNADKVLVLISGDRKPGNAAAGDMISAIQTECDEKASTEAIFIQPDTVSAPGGTAEWLHRMPTETYYHVRQGSEADMRRVIRFLTENAVNLVLSGGAACGLAHIGVIRALTEHHIPIDSISGTSMGAVIAAQYAMGLGYDAIVRNNRLLWVTSRPMRDITVPFISFLKGQKLETIAKKIYTDKQIEDLWLPFFCVSTSLTAADQVIHRRGPLFNAIRASSSVPGLVPPAVIDDEILVDGGIMNNLPVTLARQYFKGVVVAVDVTEARGLRIPQNQFPSPWKVLWRRIKEGKKAKMIPGIFDIMYHAAIVGSQRRTEQAGKAADYYLRLPLDRFKFMEFDAFDEIVEAGYRYTNQKIREWAKEGLPA